MAELLELGVRSLDAVQELSQRPDVVQLVGTGATSGGE
jgi:hypothetical protein